ncbi:hypothetical protein G9A89_012104 [Geosiphon pyriformis]|nr:hypothetical protein G9A89_012104 [Geosiphon pyriformis]
MPSLGPVVEKLLGSYNKDTPQNLKLIDVYMTFILMSGVVQFLYVCLVGTYPYNAFLAGFIATVGQFVLAGDLSINFIYIFLFMMKLAGLRIQTNLQNVSEFKTISPERFAPTRTQLKEIDKGKIPTCMETINSSLKNTKILGRVFTIIIRRFIEKYQRTGKKKRHAPLHEIVTNFGLKRNLSTVANVLYNSGLHSCISRKHMLIIVLGKLGSNQDSQEFSATLEKSLIANPLVFTFKSGRKSIMVWGGLKEPLEEWEKFDTSVLEEAITFKRQAVLESN